MQKSRAFFLVTAGLLALELLLPRHAAAAWSNDPNENLPICTAPNHQQLPAIVSDGAGGAIVAWQDSRRAYSAYDIYAQRISADGTTQWTDGGVAVPFLAIDKQPPPSSRTARAGG